MTAQPEPVRAAAEGQVLVITIDRSPVNAIDTVTSKALYQVFDRLSRDPLLRVGILTGAGDRFFSAGWDMKAAAQGESIEADHGQGGFAGLTEFFDVGKPVIAAVNGLAFDGGFELVLAADLVVAAVLEILRETEGMSERDGYRVLAGSALPAYRAMLDSQDAREGALAFAERRKPVWRGR